MYPFAHPKSNKKTDFSPITFLLFTVGFGVLLAFLFHADEEPQLGTYINKEKEIELGAFPIIKPTIKYGFVLDTFDVVEATIQPNEFLSDILTRHQVDYPSIDKLALATRKVFDVRNLRVDKPYMLLSLEDKPSAKYFVYEPDVYKYVVFDIENARAEVMERPVETQVHSASGTITSSLWNTMTDQGLSYEIAVKMEDAFAWSIDFHHIQLNDQFKLVYEQKLIDGKEVGVGKILAAYFKNFDKEYHAIYFENEKHNGFYDLQARPMKKAFLKAPVKYSRISSRYNLRRFHPVLKRRRPHLGTDYAAPYGTPIYAVADGVVTKASRTRGNGNFVKIKHDKTYQTQYLHMRRFAKGIRPGVHVKQGEVIGYVGSTGLASGPHVCFRFWKNGRQVNHLRENLPPPDPMPDEDIPSFNLVKDRYKAELEAIPLPRPVAAN